MSDIAMESNGEMAFNGNAFGFCWMPLTGETGAAMAAIQNTR